MLTAARGGLAERVESVFRDVDVERTQVDRQQAVGRVRNRLKIVDLIRAENLLCRLAVSSQRIPIDFWKTVGRYEV